MTIPCMPYCIRNGNHELTVQSQQQPDYGFLKIIIPATAPSRLGLLGTCHSCKGRASATIAKPPKALSRVRRGRLKYLD
jgi:hypothetical protein